MFKPEIGRGWEKLGRDEREAVIGGWFWLQTTLPWSGYPTHDLRRFVRITVAFKHGNYLMVSTTSVQKNGVSTKIWTRQSPEQDSGDLYVNLRFELPGYWDPETAIHSLCLSGEWEFSNAGKRCLRLYILSFTKSRCSRNVNSGILWTEL